MNDLSTWIRDARHVAIICGGAVSGSEAAAVCAERGVHALVLEQGSRPYGKIEDGLPRWHDRLQQREYARIDENFGHARVLFVPQTAVGRDVHLSEILAWHPSVTFLANGAYADRPLPIDGAAGFVGKGLYYQNPFIHWFNHYEEPGYDGPQCTVANGMIVVGGGLASIDVAKVINLELVRTALAGRGVSMTVPDLEHAGLGPTLDRLGLSTRDLGITPARIFYRRRVQDMPIAFARGDDEAALQKVQATRRKLAEVLARKFLVEVCECAAPIGALTEGEQLAGLRFERTQIVGGKVQQLAGTGYDVRAGGVISSIGSVPTPIQGVPNRGELYDFADWDTGQLRGLPGVYGLGNVLTGQGNILDSRKNARKIAPAALACYLGLDGEVSCGQPLDRTALMTGAHQAARQVAAPIAQRAASKPPMSRQDLDALGEFVQRRWVRAGYDGDYLSFVQRPR